MVFLKVMQHNFDDCVKKLGKFFNQYSGKTNHLQCKDYPYQSIDSGLFYKKINDKLKENKNISFLEIQKRSIQKIHLSLIVCQI